MKVVGSVSRHASNVDANPLPPRRPHLPFESSGATRMGPPSPECRISPPHPLCSSHHAQPTSTPTTARPRWGAAAKGNLIARLKHTRASANVMQSFALTEGNGLGSRGPMDLWGGPSYENSAGDATKSTRATTLHATWNNYWEHVWDQLCSTP